MIALIVRFKSISPLKHRNTSNSAAEAETALTSTSLEAEPGVSAGKRRYPNNRAHAEWNVDAITKRYIRQTREHGNVPDSSAGADRLRAWRLKFRNGRY